MPILCEQYETNTEREAWCLECYHKLGSLTASKLEMNTLVRLNIGTNMPMYKEHQQHGLARLHRPVHANDADAYADESREHRMDRKIFCPRQTTYTADPWFC